MRCNHCGNEYPSQYYFKIDEICLECFEKMAREKQAEVMRHSLMKHPLTSTTFTIEGHRIVKQLGVVRGLSVRSRSIIGNIGAGLQTIFGGDITLFTELCEKTRSDAFELMFQHAVDIGGNAVVGIRYDANEVMDGVAEVICYGTAVLAEPLEGG